MRFSIVTIVNDISIGSKRIVLSPAWNSETLEGTELALLITANPRVIEQLSYAKEIDIEVTKAGIANG